MTVSRRDVMSLGLRTAAGAVVGGAMMRAVDDSEQAAAARRPSPFYGGPGSGIRPNLSAPSVPTVETLWAGPTDPRRIALTFDDGPHPNWTPRVLAALAAEDVRATFFLKGSNVRDHGALHRDSATVHELANHTFDHPDLSRLAYAECVQQLAATQLVIEDTYAVTPRLLRPPYGHLGGAALLAAAEARLPVVLWSAQMRESQFVQHPSGIVDSISSSVHPGTIILAHDTGPQKHLVTIDNLRAILVRLKGLGYEFVTVSELCGLPPALPAARSARS